MHRSLLSAVLSLSILLSTLVAAQDVSYTFTPIDVPGSISTVTTGINNRGQIVGFFSDATGTHGFLTNGATFTTIDVPDSQSTQAFGINNRGQIVGYFSDATGRVHGFVTDGATFTTLDVPSATRFTHAYGINAVGQIVGFFGDDIGVLGVHGFVATPHRQTQPRR
jgi:probable HAF family extracellular repeat protein